MPTPRGVKKIKLGNTYEVLMAHSKISKYWVLFALNEFTGIRLG